jgi:hypothetical protein
VNSIATLITKRNIKLEILPTSAFACPVGLNIYTVVLKHGKKQLMLPQADRKKYNPSVKVVLEGLVEDAAVIERSKDYDGWRRESGITIEDELSKVEYSQSLWYSRALRVFLGDELYIKAIADWEAENETLSYPDKSDS